MTIGAYLLILRRYWVAVVVATLLGVAAAITVTALTPTVYVATTTQFVRGVPGSSAGAEYQAAQFATSRAKSYSALIGNPDLLSGVIDDLKLQTTPAELYSRLTVENPTDTVLINVTARASTAAEAQSISRVAADNLAKLIIRLESAGATGGKSPIDVQTAVPAPLPTSPASPRPVLNLAVGTLLGLALGSILALLLDTRSRLRRRSAAPVMRVRRVRPKAASSLAVMTETDAPKPDQPSPGDSPSAEPAKPITTKTRPGGSKTQPKESAAQPSEAEAQPVGPSSR